MADDDEVVVVCMLDDKIKVKQVLNLIVTGFVEGAFLGILIGMVALFLFVKWTEYKALERLKKFKAIIK